MIRLLDAATEDAEENLALEQALLDEMQREGAGSSGILHLWESPRYAVVLGHAGRAEYDVNRTACEQAGIPVLRRSTGGGTVLLGPGSLNYGLLLRLDAYPWSRDVRGSFCFILGRLAAALGLHGIALRGLSDLALEDRKISGNAQRRTREILLHHGTLLYGFDASAVERFLREPSRQPDYRRGRRHADFLTNIPLTRKELKCRIVSEFTSDAGSRAASRW